MITAITRALSSNALTAMATNTSSQMISETTLKAIGRPGAILVDNKISDDTKKYAAAKEFLYQATCLLVFATIIVPVFKHGTFKLAKKYLGQVRPEINQFKNANEYLDYYKLATKKMQNRLASLSKDHSENKFTPELREHLKTNEHPEAFDWIKGAIETGSFTGSILGLAILAPQISHATIHPALKFLGLEKPAEKKLDKNA